MLLLMLQLHTYTVAVASDPGWEKTLYDCFLGESFSSEDYGLSDASGDYRAFHIRLIQVG